MSMIHNVMLLGLAASFGSPINQQQTPDSVQRLNQLWLVTYIDRTGEEVVVQAKLTNGDYAPLIAADPVRLESMMPAARELAKTRHIKMRLIEFTNRLDIEDISP
jgi:hypothetical protein